jgi:hypothetical protein
MNVARPLALGAVFLAGTAALICLSWLLLNLAVDPLLAEKWWEHTLVVAYIIAPAWAPLVVLGAMHYWPLHLRPRGF